MGYSNWVNMNTRILKALQTGQDFTANQLRAKFGIRRVSDRISELRKAGYAIYLNTKTTDNGNKIKVYRLGSPRRSDIVTANFVRTRGYLPYQSEVNDCLNFVKA
jgi:transcription initiation factor IIE alpha subunit